MARRYKEGILPFRIVATDKPLTARSGLVLPYEMATSLKLPRVIDKELPPPGSGHSHKPSRFVIPLVLMLHGGGKKLEDLRARGGQLRPAQGQDKPKTWSNPAELPCFLAISLSIASFVIIGSILTRVI